MKLKKLQLIGAVLMGIGILYSCTDDYFEFDKIKTEDWTPTFAIPLVNSTLTLSDVLMNEDTNGLVQTGTNDVLQVIYEGAVKSQLGANQVSLPNETSTNTISNVLVPPGSPFTVPYNYNLPYNAPNGIEVDSMLLKRGNFRVLAQSDFQHAIQIDATMPGFKDENGTVLQFTINIPPTNGNNPITRSSDPIDLNGYTVDMTKDGSGNPTFNNIRIEMDVTITPVAGNPSSVNDELIITSDFTNVAFKQFHGYIGQDAIDLDPDTIDVGLFKNFDQGIFYLAEPFLEVNMNNSYGLPMDLVFEDLKSVNPSIGTSVDFDLSQVLTNNTVVLNSPTGPGVATTTITLDEKNSNVDLIISSLLKQIAYDAVVNPNPQGKTQRNFLTDTSAIGMDVFLRMPFKGFASGFLLFDTLDFEFENSDQLENGIVRVRASNGFPIGTQLQLYFADDRYQLIDSLVTATTGSLEIPGASTDGNGNITGNGDMVSDLSLNSARLSELKDSKYMIIRAELETTNGGAATPDTVVFKSDYRLEIAVGLKATILID